MKKRQNISTFFVSPIAIKLSKENKIFSKTFENNSNEDLKKLLENPKIKPDEALDSKFLFEDILKFDEQPIDSVRLSSSTIE